MKTNHKFNFVLIALTITGASLFAPPFASAAEQGAKQLSQQITASELAQTVNEKQELPAVSISSNSREAEMWDRMMDTFEANFQFLQWIVLIIVGIGGFFGISGVKEYAIIKKEFKEKLEKHKSELEQKHKEELGKLLKTKEEEIEKIVKSAQAKLDVRNKKILIINSGERNIGEEEIELIRNFNDFNESQNIIGISNIEEMKEKIRTENPDIIIFDPDNNKKNQKGECNDGIYNEIAGEIKEISKKKIPIIVYIKGRFDTDLLNRYFLSNLANSSFTLASWTYTMLKVMSLKDKE